MPVIADSLAYPFGQVVEVSTHDIYFPDTTLNIASH